MVLICPLRSQTTDTLTTDRWAVVYTARQVLLMICPFIERHVNMQAINTISLTFCLDFLSNNIQNKNNVCVCVCVTLQRNSLSPGAAEKRHPAPDGQMGRRATQYIHTNTPTSISHQPWYQVHRCPNNYNHFFCKGTEGVYSAADASPKRHYWPITYTHGLITS